MKVWVVQENDWEGTFVLAIYSTEENANAALKRLIKRRAETRRAEANRAVLNYHGIEPFTGAPLDAAWVERQVRAARENAENDLEVAECAVDAPDREEP